MAHTTESVDVVYGEILPLAINVTKALDEGDDVQSVSMTLHEATGYALVTDAFVGTAEVSGTTLTFILDTTKLASHNRYIAKALMTISPGAKVVAALVPVSCGF